MSKRISTFNLEIGRVELFVSDCPSCGVLFGIPSDMEARRREDRRAFHCPNGHSLSFSGPSKAEKELAEAKERAERLAVRFRAERDQAEAARQEAASAKASEIRLRWRVGNGVCPCCRRTFPGLAAHVATKHPDFILHDINTLSTRMKELLVTLRDATEQEDAAVLDVFQMGANMNTVRALVGRGLITKIDYNHVALTEVGWPLAEQIAGH